MAVIPKRVLDEMVSELGDVCLREDEARAEAAGVSDAQPSSATTFADAAALVAEATDRVAQAIEFGEDNGEIVLAAWGTLGRAQDAVRRAHEQAARARAVHERVEESAAKHERLFEKARHQVSEARKLLPSAKVPKRSSSDS